MSLPVTRPASPSRTRLRALTPLVALALAPLALTACSSDPESPAPAAATEPAAAPSSSAPTLPKGVKPASVPTKVANDVGDRKNVVMNACKTTGDGWGASGTATNPGKKDVTYKVTVFFTTTSATTIDSASTDVAVKAGETVTWDAAKKFKTPSEMLCVLRGVAAD